MDLLIGKEPNELIPFEIKLTKTPNAKMSENIHRFKKLLPQLKIERGHLLSLSEENWSLSQEVKLKPFKNYLASA